LQKLQLNNEKSSAANYEIIKHNVTSIEYFISISNYDSMLRRKQIFIDINGKRNKFMV